jgi:glucose/arabinose dehydrogenase
VQSELIRLAPLELVILGGTAVVSLVAEHRLVYPALPTLGEIEIDLVPIEGEFVSPLLVAARPGDTRLFVLQRAGQIWSTPAGGGGKTLVLDITSLTNGTATESGLLSMAFHPDDATRLFICYTVTGTMAIRIAEYAFPLAAETVTPGATTVIEVAHPSDTRHNGGMVLFGPDGYMYLSLGDGGVGDSYADNVQDPDELRSSILRIDVDTLPYQIPPSNPYADGQDGAPEVWVKGVRNPWRVSFDGDDLYVADVGEHNREELSVLEPDDAGANLGWNILEGTDCFSNGSPLCTVNDFVDPVMEYVTHSSGTCAITGGYVYRGPEADLDGIYFYSDFCQGNIRGLRVYKGVVVDSRTFADDPGFVPGFGIDTAGQVYVTSYLGATTATGTVYRIDLAS